jgi:hypothetical protein
LDLDSIDYLTNACVDWQFFCGSIDRSSPYTTSP